MLTSEHIRSLRTFTEEHAHCGNRGYYTTDGLRGRPSMMAPSNLTTFFSTNSHCCNVKCVCGSAWVFGDSAQQSEMEWNRVDDVSLDLVDHMVRLMKRPALHLGCLSETRLHLFLDGADVAMTAMNEKPRFASFLDDVYREWNEESETRLSVVPKDPYGFPDKSAYPEFEERFLSEFLDSCKSKLTDEYADLLIALIARVDHIADYYLWF